MPGARCYTLGEVGIENWRRFFGQWAREEDLAVCED